MATDDAKIFYSFNNADNTAGNPDDISGFGNNGITNGATTGVSGLINEAYSFDGVNDYVDTAYQINTGDFGFILWFKTSTKPGSQKSISYVYNGSGADSLRIHMNSTGFINTYFRIDGSNIATVTNSTDMSDGAWHSVMISRSGSTVESWIDNVSIGTGTAAGTLITTFDLYLGAGNDHNPGTPYQPWDGDLDLFGIYNHSFSSGDRTELQNSGDGFNPYAPVVATSKALGFGGGF